MRTTVGLRFYEGCLDNIKKEVSRSNEDFIKEHSEKYTYPALPPVWKTLEVVSFGTLSSTTQGRMPLRLNV